MTVKKYKEKVQNLLAGAASKAGFDVEIIDPETILGGDGSTWEADFTIRVKLGELSVSREKEEERAKDAIANVILKDAFSGMGPKRGNHGRKA